MCIFCVHTPAYTSALRSTIAHAHTHTHTHTHTHAHTQVHFLRAHTQCAVRGMSTEGGQLGSKEIERNWKAHAAPPPWAHKINKPNASGERTLLLHDVSPCHVRCIHCHNICDCVCVCVCGWWWWWWGGSNPLGTQDPNASIVCCVRSCARVYLCVHPSSCYIRRAPSFPWASIHTHTIFTHLQTSSAGWYPSLV